MSSNSQYGYKSGFEIVKPATSFVNNCLTIVDCSDHLEFKLYDLYKAFDSMLHYILFNKLRFYGLFSLTYRGKKIVLGSFKLSFLSVNHGVLQGSFGSNSLYHLY